MRHWWRGALGLLVVLGHTGLAGTARAEAGDDPVHVLPDAERAWYFELGLRSGYGIPIGKATADSTGDMNGLIAGQVPVWVDIGARFKRHLALGVYFSYGFGILGNDISQICDTVRSSLAAGVSLSCGTRDLRVGVQGGYHFAPRHSLDPWVAAGIGYEFFSFLVSSSNGSQSTTTSVDGTGFEYVNVQSGLDFRVSEHVRAGPFVGLGVASYDKMAASCSSGCGPMIDISSSSDNQSIHAWLFLGLRGVLLF